MERPPTPTDLYHAYDRALPARAKSADSLPSLHGLGSALLLPLSTTQPRSPEPRPISTSSTSSSLFDPPTTASRWALIEAAIDEVLTNPPPPRNRSQPLAPKLSPCPIQRSVAAVRQKRFPPPPQHTTDHTSRTHDFRRLSVSHIPIFDTLLPPIDARPLFSTQSILPSVLEPSLPTTTAEGVERTAALVPQPPTPGMDRGADGLRGGVAYNGREELRREMDFLHSAEAMDEFLRVARGRFRDK